MLQKSCPLFFIFLFLYNVDKGFAASGDLDITFGGTGVVLTSLGDTDWINSATIQADGNILAVGVSNSNTQDMLAIARYTTFGASDFLFGQLGSEKITFGTNTDGNAVELQTDNNIVIGGSTYDTQNEFLVVRLNPNGELDNTFNSTGFVITGTGAGDAAYSLKIQPDGKIIIGGTAVDGSPQFALVRYTTTGTLDTTFGVNGIVLTPISVFASLRAVALQQDGKIIAGGYFFDGAVIGFALARYNTDGSLDSGFGTGGIVTTSIAGYDIIYDVRIQPDGNILAAGVSDNGSGGQFVVARYDTNGNLDTTFNGTGIVVTTIQNSSVAHSVKLQSTGKIIVGGSSVGDTATQFALARYNSDGSLDATFGTGGIVLTTIGTTAEIYSLAIQSDDKIVAGGYSDNTFALARYVA